MGRNLFVGGFPYEVTQEELAKIFSAYGRVTNVKIILDRATGRSKGFGFVEMGSDEEAQAARAALHGSEIGHRKIFIDEGREGRPVHAPKAGPGGRVSAEHAPKPAFVERRSGKDRRKPGGFGAPPLPGAGAAPERRSFGEKKPWSPKPAFGGPKKFGEKPRWGDKPQFGDKPKWGEKKFGDKPKWGDKPKPWGEKKSWGDKPKRFGDKPKWGDKPSGPKKWGDKPSGPKEFGEGRAQFGKKNWRPQKGGGFGPKKGFGKRGVQ